MSDPDHVEDHFPFVCGQCGTPLSPSMAEDYAARQVFDLPATHKPLVATEHRAHVCLCGRCGETTKAAFPLEVKAPVQYGPLVFDVGRLVDGGKGPVQYGPRIAGVITTAKKQGWNIIETLNDVCRTDYSSTEIHLTSTVCRFLIADNPVNMRFFM